jgi:hypothetical protein
MAVVGDYTAGDAAAGHKICAPAQVARADRRCLDRSPSSWRDSTPPEDLVNELLALLEHVQNWPSRYARISQ